MDAFPDKDASSFEYYDDDGKTYNYEKGEYFIQDMHTQDKGNSIEFKIDSKKGSFTPNTQYYVVRIHGNAGKDIKLNGQSIQTASTIDDMMNSSNESWINSKDVYGDVTYIKVKVGEEKSIEISK